MELVNTLILKFMGVRSGIIVLILGVKHISIVRFYAKNKK
jgi:hypothetical protein